MVIFILLNACGHRGEVFWNTSFTVQKEEKIGRLSCVCHQMDEDNETDEGLIGFRIYSHSPNYFTPSGA